MQRKRVHCDVLNGIVSYMYAVSIDNPSKVKISRSAEILEINSFTSINSMHFISPLSY